MTAAEFAPAVLQAGRDLGITPRGIVIGFATVYVESGWTMYANTAVPASMIIAHEAVGSDGDSVGLFQQQVVGPPWWWGDAATCMDPYKSAVLFFQRLATHDYNNTANTPGSYAQDVQQSAFPDRYDQRMSDAQTLYNQLTAGGTTPVTTPTDPRLTALQAARPDFNEFPNWGPNSEDRQETPIDLWLIHTEESSGYDNALGLSNFLISTANTNNPVSYHYAISKGQNDDGITVVDCIDTDQAAWAVGNSNLRSINLCFAGSSVDWTRDEWVANLGRSIDVAGYLAVQDSIKYGFGDNVIPGPNYNAAPPGISDHRYCTDYLKDGNTHVDVGDNFPWDLLTAAVQKYWAIANSAAPAPTPSPTPTPTPTPTPAPAPAPDPAQPQTFQQWVSSATDRQLLEYLVNQLGPGDPSWSSKGSTLRDELWKLATPESQNAALKDESK